MADPKPTDDPEKILEWVQEKAAFGKHASLEKWINANANSLDLDTFLRVYQTVSTMPQVEVAPEVKERFTGVQKNAAGRESSGPETLKVLADKRLAGASGDLSAVNEDLDSDGRVDDSERAAVKAATDRAIKAQSEATATPEEDIRRQVEQAARLDFPDSVLQYTGGTVPDRQTIADLKKRWNEQNPDDKVSTDEDLIAKLSRPGPASTNTLESVFLGVDPITSIKVRTSKGDVELDATQVDAARQYFGLSNADLTLMVRTADRLGMSFTGYGADRNFAIIAAMVAQSGVQPRQYGTGPSLQAKPGGRGPDFGGVANQVSSDVLLPEKRPSGITAASADRAEEQIARAQGKTLDGRILKFKEGLLMYQQNEAMAFIHSANPTLAAKLSGDPTKLTQADVKEKRRIIADGKFTPEVLSAMGYESLSLSDWDDWYAMQEELKRQKEGGGRVRVKPDQDAIRQSAIDMYRALFADDPSPGTLNTLVSSVSAAIANAADDQNIDVGAQLRKRLEANPQYAELYGERPAGMTEEEYMSQFKAASSQLLGSAVAADPSAVRSGMRTGDTNTTIGAVAAGKTAWGNSSFLGRLANAGRVVSENT
jgi:hypothetical protein